MNSTAPYTEFGYATPATMVRPKIISLEPIPIFPPGHYRSIPRSIEAPVPSRRVKMPKSEERPVQIGTQDLQGKPATEPESAPTLEPVSRL